MSTRLESLSASFFQLLDFPLLRILNFIFELIVLEILSVALIIYIVILQIIFRPNSFS